MYIVLQYKKKMVSIHALMKSMSEVEVNIELFL